MPYRELQHTADLRMEVWAESIEELFIEGHKGLYAIIFGEFKPCEKGEIKGEIEIESIDIDTLFHDFLDELLYLTFVKEHFICKVEIKKLKDTYIKASYKAELLDWQQVKKEVKAITYHNLHIQQDKKGYYKTEVVMDV